MRRRDRTHQATSRIRLRLRFRFADRYSREVRSVTRFHDTRPRARGPRRPQAPAPSASADLMGQVLARIGGSGRALEFRVFDCYSRVIGAAFRAQTIAERLTGTTLVVRVASSPIAHELTLLRAEIMSRMARELGPGVVVELRTRVGRIPSSV